MKSMFASTSRTSRRRPASAAVVVSSCLPSFRLLVNSACAMFTQNRVPSYLDAIRSLGAGTRSRMTDCYASSTSRLE
jgi:hypothetical protein